MKKCKIFVCEGHTLVILIMKKIIAYKSGDVKAALHIRGKKVPGLFLFLPIIT